MLFTHFQLFQCDVWAYFEEHKLGIRAGTDERQIRSSFSTALNLSCFLTFMAVMAEKLV